jgi:dienelactone hydrolase
VAEHLTEHQHPYPVVHRIYPGAGHLFALPNVPTTVSVARHPVLGKTFAYGGTPSATARAATDAWRSVLDFLDAWRRGA